MTALLSLFLAGGCTGIALPFASQKAQKPVKSLVEPSMALPRAQVVADLHGVEVNWAGDFVPQNLQCSWIEPNLDLDWVDCSNGSWAATADQLALAAKFGDSYLKVQSTNDSTQTYRVDIRRSPLAPRGLYRDSGPAFIHALEPDGSGGFYAGGIFSYSGSHRVSGLVPLKTDGLVESVFPTMTTGFGFSPLPIRSPVVRAAIKVGNGFVVGGRISSYNGAPIRTTAGQDVRGLAKISLDGTLDSTFTNQLGLNIPTTSQGVWSLQKFSNPADASQDFLMVGGELGYVPAAGGGVANLVLLDATSLQVVVSFSLLNRRVLKAEYVPQTASGIPPRIYVASDAQSDGTVFSIYQWSSGAWGLLNSLKSTGYVMSGNPDDTVLQVSDFEVLDDERIVVVGNFNTLISGTTNFSVGGLAVLDRDGMVNDSLNLNFNGAVKSVERGLEPNSIWVGGAFAMVADQDRTHLTQLRLDNDEISVLPALSPPLGRQAGSRVESIFRNGTDLWVGGYFLDSGQAQNLVVWNLESQTRYPISKTRLGSTVFALNPGPQGSVLVGTGLTYLGGERIPQNIVHLDSSGSVSSTLFGSANAAGFSGSVVATSEAERLGAVKVIKKDANTLLVGGAMTSFGGVSVPSGLVRLHGDGTLDTGFGFDGSQPRLGATLPLIFGSNPYELGPVNAILRLDDNRILVGGNFASFHGQTRRALAVLANDGTLRSETISLSSTENYAVTVLEPLGSAHIFVGLERTSNFVPHAYIIRRDLQGGPVPVAVGGDSNFFNMEVLAARGRRHQLNSQEFFDLVVGGGFQTPTRAAHLRFAINAQGEVDLASLQRIPLPTFDAVVTAIALTESGDLVVGGNMSRMTSGSQTFIVKRGVAKLRLSPSGDYVPDPNFNRATSMTGWGLTQPTGGGTSRVFSLAVLPPGIWGGSSGALLVGTQSFGVWNDEPEFGERVVRGLFGLSGEVGLWNEFVSGFRQEEFFSEY